jgi:hypothetical protein
MLSILSLKLIRPCLLCQRGRTEQSSMVRRLVFGMQTKKQ